MEARSGWLHADPSVRLLNAAIENGINLQLAPGHRGMLI
jgi:hypothetical protein